MRSTIIYISIFNCALLKNMAERTKKSRKPTPLTISAQSGTPPETKDSTTTSSDLQTSVASSSAELVIICKSRTA